MIYGILVARSQREAQAIGKRRRVTEVCQTWDGKPVLVVPFEADWELSLFYPRPAHLTNDEGEARRLALALYDG